VVKNDCFIHHIMLIIYNIYYTTLYILLSFLNRQI